MRRLQAGIRQLNKRIQDMGTQEIFCGCVDPGVFSMLFRFDPPACQAEIHNPRLELTTRPAAGDYDRILTKLFPDGVPENLGHYAIESEEIKKEIVSQIITEPEPEPVQTGDPIRDAVAKRELLSKKELADALLVKPDATKTVSKQRSLTNAYNV
jgi:hypothetical protein